MERAQRVGDRASGASGEVASGSSGGLASGAERAGGWRAERAGGRAQRATHRTSRLAARPPGRRSGDAEGGGPGARRPRREAGDAGGLFRHLWVRAHTRGAKMHLTKEAGASGARDGGWASMRARALGERRVNAASSGRAPQAAGRAEWACGDESEQARGRTQRAAGERSKRWASVAGGASAAGGAIAASGGASAAGKAE